MEERTSAPAPATQRRLILWILLFILLAFVGYTQLCFFVVQPLGAIPEGRTLILRRTEKLEFVDSADAMCERETGQVTLLCRGAVLGAIGENGQVLARLPYSKFLYSISTGGKEYEH
jgi:hypothetical protein